MNILFLFTLHRPSQLCSLLNLDWCLNFEGIVQSYHSTCIFGIQFLTTRDVIYHLDISVRGSQGLTNLGGLYLF